MLHQDKVNIAIWLGWVANVFSQTNGEAANYSLSQWQLRQEFDWRVDKKRSFEYKQTVPTIEDLSTYTPSDDNAYVYHEGRVITVDDYVTRFCIEALDVIQTNQYTTNDTIDYTDLDDKETDEERKKRMQEERKKQEEIKRQLAAINAARLAAKKLADEEKALNEKIEI